MNRNLQRDADAPAHLDDLLDVDAPSPSPDFDQRVLAALGRVTLDDLLDADAPTPSPDFDQRVLAALGRATLDDLLDADAPTPSPNFTQTTLARLHPTLPSPAAVTPPRWRGRALLALAAAVVLASVLALRRSPPVAPSAPDERALAANLELLEIMEALPLLDVLQDEEAFEVVASLEDLLDEQPGKEAHP